MLRSGTDQQDNLLQLLYPVLLLLKFALIFPRTHPPLKDDVKQQYDQQGEDCIFTR